MKKLAKIVAAILLMAITATLFAAPVFATEGGADAPEAEEVLKVYDKAEIMMAKGGANGIVSMTFDDDHMPTALVLNELFEEYGGLKGTLYMRSARMLTSNSKENWDEVFAKGYLEPQSHGAEHLNLSNSKVDKDDPNSPTYWEQNNGEETMVTEIVGSQNTINTTFPNYDCLTFAIPNSNYHTPADELLAKTYHATRGGSCPFAGTGIQTGFGVQTLDPKVGYGAGDWSNLQIARLTPNQDGIELSENLEYLKTCAENGGWYISMTHAVFEIGKEYTGIHNDCTVDDLSTFCAAVQKYVDEGKIWCTTMSEATKYIRERQNSTVKQYETASGIYVDLTMTENTAGDELALSSDVFNLPLTVKVQLPNGWQNVTLTQNGNSTVYPTFSDKGVTFAYVELVPNSGKAQLTNSGDYGDYIDSITIYQNLTIEEEIAYNLYFPNDGNIVSVSVNEVALPAIATDKYEGYNMYTLDNLFVTDVATDYSFTVTFADELKMDPYVFNTSVLKYLSDVALSDSATEEEKQLCFDFATYTKDAFVKVMEDKKNSLPAVDQANFVIDTTPYDNTLVKYAGFILTEANLGAAANVGNLGDAFTGVSFSLNEKPYYLLHIDPAFYGTVTVTVGGSTETYEVINGYYHCKSYIIVEVDALCNLLDTLTITAVGSIGISEEPTINASGAYNVANYYETVKVNSATPAYATSLAAYITSAKAYLDAAAQG